MALITCPECGKSVSDQAQSCPHCGFPLKKDASFDGKLGQVKTVDSSVELNRNMEEYDRDTLSTAKLVLGIISLVMFLFVSFQACSVGLLTLLGESSDLGGSAGVLLAIVLLACGILGIVGRRSRKATLTAGILYIVGGVLALPNAQLYRDLIIWGIVSIVFGIVFVVSSKRMLDWEMAEMEQSKRAAQEKVQTGHFNDSFK